MQNRGKLLGILRELIEIRPCCTFGVEWSRKVKLQRLVWPFLQRISHFRVITYVKTNDEFFSTWKNKPATSQMNFYALFCNSTSMIK